MISASAFVVVIMMTTITMVSCQDNILNAVLPWLDPYCTIIEENLFGLKGFYYVQKTSIENSKSNLCHYLQISSMGDLLPATYITVVPLKNDSSITTNTTITFKKPQTSYKSPINVIAKNSDGIIVITCFENFYTQRNLTSVVIPIPRVLVCTNQQHVNSSVISGLLNSTTLDLGPLVSGTQVNCPQKM